MKKHFLGITVFLLISAAMLFAQDDGYSYLFDSNEVEAVVVQDAEPEPVQPAQPVSAQPTETASRSTVPQKP